MTIKFEKITAGMRLWDVRKGSTLRGHKWSTWPVTIVSVDSENRTVVASWNGNKAETMTERHVTKYRAKCPE